MVFAAAQFAYNLGTYKHMLPTAQARQINLALPSYTEALIIVEAYLSTSLGITCCLGNVFLETRQSTVCLSHSINCEQLRSHTCTC